MKFSSHYIRLILAFVVYISAGEVRDCVTVEWVKDLEVTEVEIPVIDIELPNENE
jgi:hypothetical protein